MTDGGGNGAALRAIVESQGGVIGTDKKTCCIFHAENTPSMTCYDNGTFHCYGCNKNGDAIDILVELGNMTPADALKHAQDTYGWEPRFAGKAMPAPTQTQTRQRAVRRPAPAKKTRRAAGALPSSAIARHNYHDATGNLVFTVCRMPRSSRAKCLPFTPTGDGKWRAGLPSGQRPLYRLTLIRDDDTVIVVEGEQCADDLAKLQAEFDGISPVSWAGGANATAHTDWTPLQSRDVVIVADADDPGRGAAQKIAAVLAPIARRVRLALPDGDDGRDVSDVIADSGGSACMEWISKMLKPAPAPVPAAPAPAAPAAPVDDDVGAPEPLPTGTAADAAWLLDNPHFRVLGISDNATIAVQIAIGIIIDVPIVAVGGGSEGQLLRLAPLNYWTQISGWDRSKRVRIGDTIITEAKRLGLIDTSNKFGRGAFVRMGKICWHVGNAVIDDGQEHRLQDVSMQSSEILECRPRLNLQPGQADDHVPGVLSSALMRYRWRTPDDCRIFCGWMVSAIVGGALPWRPHLWLMAPAAAGKSWLLSEVLQPVLAGWCHSLDDRTAAALSREMASDALPVLLDEIEPAGGYVADVLDLCKLASAGGGGVRARAGRLDGVSVKQRLRFSACLSSTASAHLDAAYRSRFAVSRLSTRGVDDWPAVRDGILAAVGRGRAGALLSAAVRDAQQILALCRAKTEALSAETDTRNALIYGALSGCWSWLAGTDETITPPGRAGADDSDAAGLLIRIAEIGISGTAEGAGGWRWEATIGEALMDACSGNGQTARARAARRMGIGAHRLMGPDDELLNVQILIWPGSEELRRRLPQEYRRTNLEELLLQAPSAQRTEKRHQFGGVRQRAITIDAFQAHQMGLDIFGNDEE